MQAKSWLLTLTLIVCFLTTAFGPTTVGKLGESAPPLPGSSAPSANFSMGVDVTGILKPISEPNGEKLVDQLVDLHVTFVRFEFKAADPVNLLWYDRAIARLETRGIGIMAVLVDPWITCHNDPAERDPEVFAQWVRTVYLNGCSVDSPTTTHQLGFNELTARYPHITYWEIWNEPNVCSFFIPDPHLCGYALWRDDGLGGPKVSLRYGMQKFGKLITTVYTERANKDVKIVTGGMLNAYNCSAEYDTPCNTDAHPGPENCYKLTPWQNYGCDGGTNLFMNSDAVQNYKRDHNGKLPFDIYGIHTYQHAAWSDGYVPPAKYVTDDIKRNVRRFIDSNYPIWITEWSFDLASNVNQPPTCKFPVTATTVAGCEQNSAALLESLIGGINNRPDLNINALFWFNFIDPNHKLETGLQDDTGRKRLTWYSFQAAAEHFGSAAQQQAIIDIQPYLLKGLVVTAPDKTSSPAPLSSQLSDSADASSIFTQMIAYFVEKIKLFK